MSKQSTEVSSDFSDTSSMVDLNQEEVQEVATAVNNLSSESQETLLESEAQTKEISKKFDDENLISDKKVKEHKSTSNKTKDEKSAQKKKIKDENLVNDKKARDHKSADAERNSGKFEESSLDFTDDQVVSNNKNSKEKFRKRIFVKNLNYDLTGEELEKEFTRFGQIISAEVVMHHEGKRNRGIGYVEFATEEAARDALEMNGKELQSRKLLVDFAVNKSSNPFWSVYVKNLPYSVTRDELLVFFKKYGELHNASVPVDPEFPGRNRGYGFVDFMDEASANKVCNSKLVYKNKRPLFASLVERDSKKNFKRDSPQNKKMKRFYDEATEEDREYEKMRGKNLHENRDKKTSKFDGHRVSNRNKRFPGKENHSDRKFDRASGSKSFNSKNSFKNKKHENNFAVKNVDGSKKLKKTNKIVFNEDVSD